MYSASTALIPTCPGGTENDGNVGQENVHFQPTLPDLVFSPILFSRIFACLVV